MRLRIQSRVIGVFPHNVKPVIDLHPKASLDGGMEAARKFSLCWHPAKILYTLECCDFRGRWLPVCFFLNGTRVNKKRVQMLAPYGAVSNCTQISINKNEVNNA